MKRQKILFVEDDQFLRKIYFTKLSKENLELKAAVDGEEGLELAKSEKPDLIILDMILPKMNGFEVLQELKNDNKTKKIPVVVLSNLGQESDVDRAMSMGAVDYLIKTDFSINEVVDKIGKYLGESKTKIAKMKKDEEKKQQADDLDDLVLEKEDLEKKIKAMERKLKKKKKK